MDFSRPDNARTINTLKVLNALRRTDASRAELSRILLINKVSVSEITENLIRDGLVESGEKDNTTQGRPSTKLSIAKKKGRVFSFVFSDTTVTASASNLMGQVLRFERFPKDEAMISQTASFINKMTSDSPVVYGVTVVSGKREEIPASAFPWSVTYTSRVMAEARAEIEADRKEKTLYVSWGEDIEAAYYEKFLHYIPSFGHMKVINGVPCSCGADGCLCAVASLRKLKKTTGISQYRHLLTEEKGLLAIDDASKSLAFALGEAVQALGAERVIITGELSAMNDDLYAGINDTLRMMLPPSRRDITVSRASKGDRASLEGAGIIALDEFFYHSDVLEKLAEIQSSL